MKTFTYTRKVQFADTDMAGVVHFSTILRYVEEAEHEALIQVGVDPISKEGGFPKVRVECDYRRPLRFGDEASIEMNLLELGKSSLSWSFEITMNGAQAAEGKVVTAHVNRAGESEEIPREYRKRLS